LGEITWTNTKVRLGELVPWSRNPKTISKVHAKRLLEYWDKLGQFQSIAISESGDVYDGHQRLSVLLAAHGKDYEVDARQSSRLLTEKEREELVIAAHVGTVGQFDWEQLSGWEAQELITWGLDESTLRDWMCDTSALKNLLGSENVEWEGMPEFENSSVDGAIKSITVHFESEKDISDFSELINQTVTPKTIYVWYPKRERENLKAFVAHES